MKKYLILILAVSFCLVVAGSAIAAEQVMKPGARMMEKAPVASGGVMTGVTTTCPPNFTVVSTNPLSCKRMQPSNPCPAGFTVQWGPGCSPNLGSFGANADAMNNDPQYANCAFKCKPIKPSFTIKCNAGYTPYVGFCEAGCQMIPK